MKIDSPTRDAGSLCGTGNYSPLISGPACQAGDVRIVFGVARSAPGESAVKCARKKCQQREARGDLCWEPRNNKSIVIVIIIRA